MPNITDLSMKLILDRLDQLDKKLDGLKETADEQWRMIQAHQTYWDGTFLLGKVAGIIGAVLAFLWSMIDQVVAFLWPPKGG